MSPLERRLIAARAAQAPINEALTTNERILMLNVEHKRQLSALASVKERAARKVEFLPMYADFVQGAMSNTDGLAERDAQLFTLLIMWHIDAGLVTDALTMARYSLDNHLGVPDRHKRKLPVILAEEVADYELQARTTPFDVMRQYVDLLDALDMPDQVKARLHKATAFAHEREPDADKAITLQHLKRALDLDANVGVKKDIERVERDIKNANKELAGGGQTPPPAN